MGTRNSAETVSGILLAFCEQSTWKQAELARRLGIGVKTLRKHLDELSCEGYPLVSEHEHPHVYWSVPHEWLPKSVAFPELEVPDLLRVLLRSPRSQARSRLVARILEHAPIARPLAALDQGIATPPISAELAKTFVTLEDAIARRIALRFEYFSAHRGTLSARHASVYRLFGSPATRFVARCHRNDALKWFRVDNVTKAHLDPDEPFRPTEEDELRAYEEGSVDGFRTGDTPVEAEVFLRHPDARWATKTAPSVMEEQDAPDGVRLRTKTAALVQLARWIVGLGGIATAESPKALRTLVRDLAAAAIAAHPESEDPAS